jgi:hypothetical protein
MGGYVARMTGSSRHVSASRQREKKQAAGKKAGSGKKSRQREKKQAAKEKLGK